LAEQVETYSGHRLHERPLRFTVQGSWLKVVQVLYRWQEPGILGFTLLAEDGHKYTLEYNQEQDLWKAGLSRS
jgi:hypothetical protein